MAFVGPPEMTAGTRTVIGQTADARSEIREEACKAHRTENEDPTEVAADAAATAQRDADVNDLTRQVQRLLLFRHLARRAELIGWQPSPPPVLLPVAAEESTIAELVCAVAVLQESVNAPATEDVVAEVAQMVADAAAKAPSSAVMPAPAEQVVRLLRIARGDERVQRTDADVALDARVHTEMIEAENRAAAAAKKREEEQELQRQQQQRRERPDKDPNDTLDPVLGAPLAPAPKQRRVRTYASAPHSFEATGFSVAQSRRIIQLRKFSTSQMEAEFRLWAECMRSGRPASELLCERSEYPQAHELETRFFPAPKNTPWGKAPVERVSDVHDDLPEAWNVATRLVEVITVTIQPNNDAGDAPGVFYRVIVTDLRGRPLDVASAEAPTPADAFHQAIHGGTAVLSENNEESVIGPPTLRDAHPTIIAPTAELDPAQRALVERLHEPAAALRCFVERHFRAVCNPPHDSPGVRGRLGQLRTLLSAIGTLLDDDITHGRTTTVSEALKRWPAAPSDARPKPARGGGGGNGGGQSSSGSKRSRQPGDQRNDTSHHRTTSSRRNAPYAKHSDSWTHDQL